MDEYTLAEAIDLAKSYYLSDIPFALEGSHGIGKSQSLEQLSKELDVGFVDLRLTLLEETDLLGVPKLDGNKTSYATPIWLQMIEQTGKSKGLLVLEELNRCDRLVRQPALQLLWDRQCLHWKLPDGWLPVSTWNPSDGNYETCDLDPALKSRLITIKVKADVPTWVRWAKQAEIHPDIIAFIENYPEYLNSAVNELTPRHWYLTSKIYSNFTNEFRLLHPVLGNDAAIRFQQFIIRKNHLPTGAEIIEEKAKEKLSKLVKNPSYLNYLNETVMEHVLQRIKGQNKPESELSSYGIEKFVTGLQVYLEMIHPDAALAALELLKRKDEKALKVLLGWLEKTGDKTRSKTKSLMKHLFGDVPA